MVQKKSESGDIQVIKCHAVPHSVPVPHSVLHSIPHSMFAPFIDLFVAFWKFHRYTHVGLQIQVKRFLKRLFHFPGKLTLCTKLVQNMVLLGF